MPYFPSVFGVESVQNAGYVSRTLVFFVTSRLKALRVLLTITPSISVHNGVSEAKGQRFYGVSLTKPLYFS
jgi:hypothetical protein